MAAAKNTPPPLTVNSTTFATSSSGQDKVTILGKSKENDGEDQRLLQHIFLPPEESAVLGSGEQRKILGFNNLCDFLDEQVQDAVQESRSFIEKSTSTDDIGRLGPENVVFDFKGNLGTLIIEADRLGLFSHSNFSSIRANSCVFKGKWIYEVMLGSRGVMQVGWCTSNCVFSQEEGVGDTEDSYAYDGNRIRKWNMKSPAKYGEVWLTGDVISCAIDCDKGSVSFYRNGRCMGEAYNDLRLGQGIAYFPAVSLSMSENLRANFGATPLRYPIEGYRPLQDPPAMDLIKCQHLLEYLERIVPLMVETQQAQKPVVDIPVMARDYTPVRSKMATLMLTAAHVFDRLAPLLKTPYVIEAGLLKFLLQFCEVREVCGDHLLIQNSLDVIWAFMQEAERKPCLDYLMSSLVSAYRFSPATPDFGYQLTFLVLTYAVLKHEKTRKYMIRHVLFDKIKFPTFLHVKPPDDEGILEIIPTVCLDLGDKIKDDEDDEAETPSEETLQQRQEYFEACDELRRRVAELEYMQVEIMKLLLINNDNTKGGASTRFVFLHKFREFLKDNMPSTSRTHLTLMNQCPLSVSLCFFHRLVRAVRHYWDEFYEDHSSHSVNSSEAFVPCRGFYDDSINYFEMQRLGGLLSHLKKTNREELQSVTRPHPSTLPPHMDLVLNTSAHVDAHKNLITDMPLGEDHASCHSLVELLDGAILLYDMAAHKQLSKMCTLRETVHEYLDSLKETERKIKMCPEMLTEVMFELTRSRKVLMDKGMEQVRQMAWVIAVVYAQEKQEDVYWLLQVILRTIKKASDKGKLFSFMPDFYIDACINTYHSLKSYFHPTRPYCNLPGFSEVLNQFAYFLSEHFADERIVNADSKDTLVQALACFVCYPHSLRTMENISHESRVKLTKALLAPYENRSWAQTNWILVRLWKGCGFGFRYAHLPHLSPAKVQPDLVGATIRKPCPSLVFQQHVADAMKSDEQAAVKFIDTVLSQLNWAFSEFIGMLQELQSIASRPTGAFIDTRHLKICATCFDISVGLLRVLEMITRLVPEYFTDWSKPSAEQLLCRLCQLLTQVLNRITSKSNTFDMVVVASMPGLETVDHFPALAAVTGILVQLCLRSSEKSRQCAVQALVAEPGFQIDGLEFLSSDGSVSGGSEEGASALPLPSSSKKPFSFQNYRENVTDEEFQTMEKLISLIKEQQNQEQKQISVIDEDLLCEICYARPKSVRFQPCGHRSCKSCISHQMMNKKECFFCKGSITGVEDENK